MEPRRFYSIAPRYRLSAVFSGVCSNQYCLTVLFFPAADFCRRVQSTPKTRFVNMDLATVLCYRCADFSPAGRGVKEDTIR